MKVSIENVEATLLERKVDPPKVQEIVRDLLKAIEEEKEERNNNDPKVKWEYVIVLDDKNNILQGQEIAGWVVQQQEGEDAGIVISKLRDAAKAQNESAKRKKNTLTSIRDIFEGLKSKFTKEKKLRIKTKELTRVLIHNE